jgi:hypothetical protein
VCLVRLEFGQEGSAARPELTYAVIDCVLTVEENEESSTPAVLLDLEFFDDDCLVVVCRTRSLEGKVVRSGERRNKKKKKKLC